MRQPDDCLNDGVVFGIHRLNERLIDFQGVDWKTTEIAQRRISGAKIVAIKQGIFDLARACASYLNHSSDMQTECALSQWLASQNGWQG
jgi:hypothetical protein